MPRHPIVQNLVQGFLKFLLLHIGAVWPTFGDISYQVISVETNLLKNVINVDTPALVIFPPPNEELFSGVEGLALIMPFES